MLSWKWDLCLEEINETFINDLDESPIQSDGSQTRGADAYSGNHAVWNNLGGRGAGRNIECLEVFLNIERAAYGRLEVPTHLPVAPYQDACQAKSLAVGQLNEPRTCEGTASRACRGRSRGKAA